MRKNKSNMYTVQGYKQNGNPAELLIEESVDFCPFCLRTQNLNRENVFVIDNPFEAASIVYRCNTRDCQNPFLVKYECDPMDGKWSDRLDLNQRPPPPQGGALPGCATVRLHVVFLAGHGQFVMHL
jgi:hypothetical protein